MAILKYYRLSGRILWESENEQIELAYNPPLYCTADDIQTYHYNAVLGILNIRDKKSNLSYELLLLVTKSTSVGLYEEHEVYKIEQINFVNITDCSASLPVAQNIRVFIQTHDFYYTFMTMENQFCWNNHMKNNLHKYLEANRCWKLNRRPILPSLFCGYFTSEIIGSSSGLYTLKLLSMVSTRKVGVRLLCRGINSNGDVSLFVRTRFQLKRNNKEVFSFLILRGSIPLFWYHLASLPNLLELRDSEETERAFSLHFEKLKLEYGNVHVINLLGDRKHENLLTTNFNKYLDEHKIPYTNFDLNAHTNNYEKLKFLLYYKLRDAKNVTFRVNCLDCLDRTNLAQYLICRYQMEEIVQDCDVLDVMQKIWTSNGNSLSKLYTGADAMKSELASKGKRSIFGYVDDFFISATRFINGRFTDKQKHKIINLLLEKIEETDTSDETENMTT